MAITNKKIGMELVSDCEKYISSVKHQSYDTFFTLIRELMVNFRAVDEDLLIRMLTSNLSITTRALKEHNGSRFLEFAVRNLSDKGFNIVCGICKNDTFVEELNMRDAYDSSKIFDRYVYLGKILHSTGWKSPIHMTILPVEKIKENLLKVYNESKTPTAIGIAYPNLLLLSSDEQLSMYEKTFVDKYFDHVADKIEKCRRKGIDLRKYLRLCNSRKNMFYKYNGLVNMIGKHRRLPHAVDDMIIQFLHGK